MTSWQNVRPERDGARTMHRQMNLDVAGNAILKQWLEAVLPVAAEPTGKADQLRGADFLVSVPGRKLADGPVSLDGKIDSYTSGNMTLEIVSQDRGTKSRAEPARGWVSKDSAIVAYMFIKTGEVLFLNMRLLTPWLKENLQAVADGMGLRCGVPTSWPSGTPNRAYVSFNLVVKVAAMMRSAPGVVYVRLPEMIGEAEYERAIAMQRKDYMYDVVDPHAVPTLAQWLMEEPAWSAKDWFEEAETERLLRWFEGNVRFNSMVADLGASLKASRQRVRLPEDGAQAGQDPGN